MHGCWNTHTDDEGKLVQRIQKVANTARTFTWDYRDLLTSVSENGTTIATYTCDTGDRRISKSVAGTTTRFVYDRGNVYLEFSGTSATPSTRYLHGPMVDQVLAQESNSQTTWMLTDHLRSVRDLVNNSGAVVNHFTYDSFGQVVGSMAGATVDTRYKFTGREYDSETGLYYYRARYYNAAVGRFIGQDPIGVKAEDSNLYRYVGNNPISNTDPSGLITFVISGGFNNLGSLIPNILRNARYRVTPIYNPTVSLPGPIGEVFRLNRAKSMIDAQLRFRPLQPNEPINLVIHSDGNSLSKGLLEYLKSRYTCRVNIARLDPTLIDKPSYLGDVQVVDVGSNNPGSLDPRDRFSLWFLRPDFRAKQGVSHDGLLNDKDTIERLNRSRFFGGYDFNFYILLRINRTMRYLVDFLYGCLLLLSLIGFHTLTFGVFNPTLYFVNYGFNLIKSFINNHLLLIPYTAAFIIHMAFSAICVLLRSLRREELTMLDIVLVSVTPAFLIFLTGSLAAFINMVFKFEDQAIYKVFSLEAIQVTTSNTIIIYAGCLIGWLILRGYQT